MSGSPVLAIKRAKAKLSSASNSGGDGESYASQLLQEEESDSVVISRSTFIDLRKETLDETISEAGSDEEEVISVDDSDQSSQQPRSQQQSEEPAPSHCAVSEVDELTLLMEETPMKKLRFKEREAAKASKNADLWGCLQLRQEILGLAKLYGPKAVYEHENKFPMLLSDAHFKLAQAYTALQCLPQATVHCNRALETMPPYGDSHDKVVGFREDINILLAETLLKANPPKPQAALHYMFAAAGVDDIEAIKDPGIRVLAAQCYTLLGAAKLDEAHATRNAHRALQQRIDSLEARKEEVSSKSTEYERLNIRIKETRNEFNEEEQFEKVLIEEARSQLDKASDVLMCVIDEEETRMRKRIDDYKEHPLIKALWRQACEVLYKGALVEGLAGNVKAQIKALGEIHSAHAVYNCVQGSLMCRTLKEQGAAYVANARSSSETASDNLNMALEKYNSLLELQSQRYADNSAKQAVAQAETFKLIGNVYVAKRQWNRAKEYFQQAIDIYASYLGPDSAMVQDLEHRMQEVQSYVDM